MTPRIKRHIRSWFDHFGSTQSYAHVQTFASNHNAAKKSAFRALRQSIDALNFFADMVTNRGASVFLVGEVGYGVAASALVEHGGAEHYSVLYSAEGALGTVPVQTTRHRKSEVWRDMYRSASAGSSTPRWRTSLWQRLH